MKNIIIAFSILVGFMACQNEDYLIDGGLADPNVGTTTMGFLESHPQLDTLAILINRAGLSEVVNGETTLFAPNNLSIQKYVDERIKDVRKTDPTANYTIDNIPTDTLKKYLGGYIFQGKITRDDMTKEGTLLTAFNGETKRISLEPTNQYSGQLDNFPEYVYYSSMQGDGWDPWDKPIDDNKHVIRTSNLLSTNGVIHAIQGNHILFNYRSQN